MTLLFAQLSQSEKDECLKNHFQIDAFFFSSSSILVPKLLAKGYCAHSRRRNKCAKKCKEEDKKVSKISTVMTSCVISTIFTKNIDPQKFPPPFQMENQSEAKRISVLPSFWSKKPQSSSLWFTLMRDQRVSTWTSAVMALRWKHLQLGKSVIKILFLVTNLANSKFKKSKSHSDFLSRVRDAKGNLNSTDVKLTPQKLASIILFLNSDLADLFGQISFKALWTQMLLLPCMVLVVEAFLPIYIVHCRIEQTTRTNPSSNVMDTFGILIAS